MSNLNLTNLPIENLEKIFKFLNLNDIKNVTLVCKQFNEVVGSSKALMNKMRLIINEYENDADDEMNKKEDYTQLTLSNRKYQAIEMSLYKDQEDNEILKSFLQRQSSINDVQFTESHMKASHFQFFLNCVNQKVTKLKIDTSIESDCDVIAMEFPNLKNLLLNCRSEDGFDFLILAKFFREAKNVEIFCCEDDLITNFYQLKLFWQFIESMINLRDLDLYSENFRSYELLTTQLKLENLSIYRSYNYDDSFSTETLYNTAKFFDTQRSTLTNLSLYGFYITPQMQQSILNMKKLKYLKLEEATFIASTEENEIAYNTNYSIEEIESNIIESNEMMIQDFFMKCAGLKKLDLNLDKLSFDMLYTLAHYLESLETLSLSGRSLFPMAMPKIKEMALIRYREADVENVIRMIRLNRQLKTLKLHKSFENNPRCISAIQEINVNVEFS